MASENARDAFDDDDSESLAEAYDDRRSLRQRALSATKSVAGTVGEGARRGIEMAKQGAQEVASTTREGAAQAREDGQRLTADNPGQTGGRILRVSYSDELGAWRVAGRTGGFGTYDTKQAAVSAAEGVFDEQDLYNRLVVETRAGAVQVNRSKGIDTADEADPQYAQSTQEQVIDAGTQQAARTGRASPRFVQESQQYQPTPETRGDENETTEAAAAGLFGLGFGGPGDGSFLVGVDEDEDGQFQRDEIGLFGPRGSREPAASEREVQRPELRFLGDTSADDEEAYNPLHPWDTMSDDADDWIF